MMLLILKLHRVSSQQISPKQVIQTILKHIKHILFENNENLKRGKGTRLSIRFFKILAKHLRRFWRHIKQLKKLRNSLSQT